jgi:UDP-glucuronate 4-epimerase
MRYLVTGGAGFIGSHLSEALLARGDEVTCLDNFNDYYSPERKRRHIAVAQTHPGYTLVEADIRDTDALESIFQRYKP